MSEPDGRHSSTSTGRPPADRPTEVLHPVAHDPRQHTVVGTPVAYPSPHSADDAAAHDGRRQRHDTRSTGDAHDGTATRPDYRDLPVVVRRADTLAGLLLLLAGIAAGVSLLVVWVHGGATGLELVRDGSADLRNPQRLVGRDTWEPLAVAFGGAALFLLGLLMYVPAKTHRFLGVLALLVTLTVAAGVLVPLADARWDVHRWAVGGWFAVAVGGFGFLGALKALMTGPRSRRS